MEVLPSVAAAAHLSAAAEIGTQGLVSFWVLPTTMGGGWCPSSADRNAGVHVFTWAHPCSLLCECSALALFPPGGAGAFRWEGELSSRMHGMAAVSVSLF